MSYRAVFSKSNFTRVLMGLQITHVDAFTNKPFSGNPAAVCILSTPRDERWMQAVAREMNLSETAFLLKQGDGYSLRWFTPAVEVDLCGHATLASAHVLWEEGHLRREEEARFHTRSGLLTAVKEQNWIEMDFPAEPEEPAELPGEVVKALGVTPRYAGRNRFDYLVEVDSEQTLRNLRPDFSLLRATGVRGIIVTSVSSTSEFDFVSRFFAPVVGIDEDPVTGSAHCCLGPFWKKRLGKDEFVAYQASARGGVVRVRVGERRVSLGGQAVTILKGEIQDEQE